MRYLSTLVLVALATVAAASADDYREIESSHPLTAEQAVHIDFHSGDLEIEASAGKEVEIELEIECEWRRSDCEDLLDDVDVRWRSSKRRLFLEVEGLASWRRARVEVNATVRMPVDAPLSVEMAAGRLTIDGPKSDVRVDMGAGEVRVWMPEAAVEGVAVDVGVGDAKFRGSKEYLSGRRKMLIGSEVYWDDGPGEARIDIELGAGDATVWLD